METISLKLSWFRFDSRFSKSRSLSALLGLSLLLLSACSEGDREPRLLRLGYSPADETLNKRQSAYDALSDYLSLATGYDVELTRVNSQQPAIAAMKAGEIDIMNFGSQAYLIAEDADAAEAFALRGDTAGRPHVYQSVVIAPTALPYTTIEDAIQHASQLRILYTSPASTSGYLVARTFYESVGIDPIQSFASADFTNSHALSILRISNGQADLANVSSRILEALLREGKVDADSFRVLWKSDEIPHGPVAYRPSLAPALKEKISRAYFDMHREAPEVLSQIQQLYSERDFVYIPFATATYHPLRELRE